jgi:hypothetical protein
VATLLQPSDYRRTPWKNGGGITIDIAEHGDDWRFGRTPITAPGPFSDYTGYDRLQVLVAGRGLVLHTPDGDIDVRTPFKPVRFRGETPIVSELEAGPVEVVNLIGARAKVRLDLVVLNAGASRELGKGIHFVYAPTAAARVDGRGLPADHCLRLEPEGPTMLAVQDGIVLVGSIICA